MSSVPADLLGPFLAAATSAAASRSDVDADLARELMGEAARVLHDGVVLDHLDPDDRAVAIAALAEDLTATDPGAAARSRAASVDPTLHDPDGVRGAYLVAVQVLGL